MENTTPQTDTRPQIGQIYDVRGLKCRIFKIHPFGTMDVEEINGERAFRVTGLSFR